MVDESTIRRRFRLIAAHLDERMRRLVAAAEAAALGFGGVSIVARATGVSRRAIRIGATELRQKPRVVGAAGRVRRPGGGRKKTVHQDRTLLRDLEALIEPVTRGDPESPLRWTAKSVRRLAAELQRQGHRSSHRMVAEMLHELGYSLQANAKPIEGARHPTATRSSSTSMKKWANFWRNESRSFRWTLRRRSWSENSRTWDESCVHKGNRRMCGCTILSFPN